MTRTDVAALAAQLRARDPAWYDAWLAGAQLTLAEGGLHITVGTAFMAGYLRKEQHAMLLEAVAQALGQPTAISYFVAAHPVATQPAAPAQPPLDAIFRAVLPEVQRDFFIPELSEVALKDDVHLMELAPFTLQPRGETRTELTYSTAAGMDIRITASPTHGLPTSNDYHIVLMMQSYLANMANHYRAELKRFAAEKAAGKAAREPAKPPRYFQPTVSEILSFTRTARGGIQYDRIMAGLTRLENTRCRIDMRGRRKTRVGSFNFIGNWTVVKDNATNDVTQVRINIPDWIYEGIVEVERPTILTYDQDYLLLNDPFLMVFYRFMRLKVNKATDRHVFTAADLHARSNSRQTLKEFNRELRAKIKKTNGHLLGYQLTLVGNRDTLGVEVRMLVDDAKDLPGPDISADELLPGLDDPV